MAEDLGLSHQALLERLRLDELASRTGFSKTRISAFLRGIEYQPS